MNRTEARPLDSLDPRLARICDAHLGALRVPGASVALVVNDRCYHLAWGHKSVGVNDPVTLNTGFDIGSGSKSFVSATVASLVADGLVNWDDPVVRHVPEFELYDPWVTQQVSFRDLCGNRLGLPRAGLMEAGLSPSYPAEYVFPRLRHTAPIAPFRSRFTYVNAGHTAAAVAAGRITGLGFLATLRQRILSPLGMNNTSGGFEARSALADQAGWHAHVQGRPVAIESLFTDQFLGAGGMVVSGADALQWLRLHLGGGLVNGVQVVERKALLETHTPQVVARPGSDILSLFCPDAHMASYGLGWAVSDLQGHPLVCHSGAIFGATSMTLLLPSDGIGIAVYANSAAPVTTPLAYALASVLLNLPARDWAAWYERATLRALGQTTHEAAALADTALQTDHPLDLTPFVGRFEHPADGELLLSAAEGGLMGHVPQGYRMGFRALPMLKAGEQVFRVLFEHTERQSAPPGELRFTIANGYAVSVLFSFGVGSREFTRSDRN